MMVTPYLPLLDRVTSALEMAVMIPFVLDLRALCHARDSRPLSLRAQYLYATYCALVAINFALLGQYWTAAADSAWLPAYALKICLIYRYRRGGANG